MSTPIEGQLPVDIDGNVEIPTFAEAKRMQASLVKSLESEGSKKASAQAVLISKCKKDSRCLQPQCPVCERRRARGGELIRYLGERVLGVAPEEVRIRGERRALDATKVAFIAASMSEIGQTVPILVEWDSRNKKQKFSLVDGGYRLAAAKQLGLEEIRIIPIPGSMNDEAELVQRAANFYRVDLSALESAEHLERIRELVRERSEEGQRAPPGGRQPHDTGIKKTARRLGVTKEEVRRAKRISAISMEAKAEIRRLKLDYNQTALLEIARQPTSAEQVLAALALARARDDVQGDLTTAEELAATEIENLQAGISRQQKVIEKARVALNIRQDRVMQLQSNPGLAVDLPAVINPEPPAAPSPAGEMLVIREEGENAVLSADPFQQAVTAWRATPCALYLTTVDRSTARRFIAAVFAGFLEPREYDGLISLPEEVPG